MSTATETWPTWWNSDPEHAPAILALTKLRSLSYIRCRSDDDWYIDFEDLWEHGPCSSGERVLIALGWCLYNLTSATQYSEERYVAARAQQDRDAGGWASLTGTPLYLANPSRALESLGGGFWRVYKEMLDLAAGDR